ncbi:MAG: magnesium transporter [Gaiellales bacterium]|nr:magnesium transporter [Gaiellales bacterium]
MEVLDRIDASRIRALGERGEFFWLDLEAPTDAAVDELAELLTLPPLAAEDTREFGQRPKIDDYGDRLLIVFYAVPDKGDMALVEVHFQVSASFVVTVHRAPLPALRSVRTEKAHTPADLIYRVLDTLSESFLTRLRAIEQEVLELESRAFDRPTDAEHRRITELRGLLFRLLQVVGPQKEMLLTGGGLLEHLPGLEHDEARHRFRDVHDDFVLAANLIAYCREILGEALNVYLQSTSNRLNRVATRITLMATIFIPLTLITGFFGQNFGWLVDHIDTLKTFLIWGVGGMVIPTVVIVAVLRRTGYLSGDGQ